MNQLVVSKIREIAYRIWVEEGCKDGDELIEVTRGVCTNTIKNLVICKIPRKQLHWEAAEAEFFYGPDFSSW